MPEGLASALFDLLAQRRRETLSRGWPQIPEWVFCSTAGTSWEERNFSRLWYRLRRRAQKQGVRPLKLHTTRAHLGHVRPTREQERPVGR